MPPLNRSCSGFSEKPAGAIEPVALLCRFTDVRLQKNRNTKSSPLVRHFNRTYDLSTLIPRYVNLMLVIL
jgi:hypothetical protein